MAYRPLQEPKELWRTLTKKLNDAFDFLHNFAGDMTGKVQKSLEVADEKAQLKNDLTDAQILPLLVYGTDDDGNRGWRRELEISRQVTAPVPVWDGRLWIDTSGATWILKVYDGESWISLGAVGAVSQEYRTIDFKMLWTEEAIVGEKIHHYKLVITKHASPETAGALVDVFTKTSQENFSVFTGAVIDDFPSGGVHPNWHGLKARYIVPEETVWEEGVVYNVFVQPWNETDSGWGALRYEKSILL